MVDEPCRRANQPVENARAHEVRADCLCASPSTRNGHAMTQIRRKERDPNIIHRPLAQQVER